MTLLESVNTHIIWKTDNIWYNKCLICYRLRNYSNKWNAYLGINKKCVFCYNNNKPSIKFNELLKNGLILVDHSIFYKKCNGCNKNIRYKSKRNIIFNINKLCRSCSKIGTKCSEKTKRKMSLSKIGIKLSDETKLKLSKQKIGNKNPMFGKKITEITRTKLRVSAIKRVWKNNGMINIDKGSSLFFHILNNLSAKYGYDYFFKLNYTIKKLGYVVDAYDYKNKIIIEYDTKYHNNDVQFKKDLIRQTNIINNSSSLNEFWRYNIVKKSIICVYKRNG